MEFGGANVPPKPTNPDSNKTQQQLPDKDLQDELIDKIKVLCPKRLFEQFEHFCYNVSSLAE